MLSHDGERCICQPRTRPLKIWVRYNENAVIFLITFIILRHSYIYNDKNVYSTRRCDLYWSFFQMRLSEPCHQQDPDLRYLL